ncbi:MAG TPA: anti-sigma factor [Terriglobales bacterium]|nr:anti-sigma factor [Terriglobales bacterium]
MTCTDFQNKLPDMIDGEAAGEHAAHLKACALCSDLVADLRAISTGAKVLCAADEPSPRVWANIQRALEAEGLVRTPRQAGGVLVPPRRRWAPAWLVAIAALVVVGFGLLIQQNRSAQPMQGAKEAAATTRGATEPATSADDDQQILAQLSPAMRTTYENNLKDVNAFIRDANDSLARNPNNDEARHFLMDAYQQKAMVYELAMDRTQ